MRTLQKGEAHLRARRMRNFTVTELDRHARNMRRLQCCGVMEYHGLEAVRNVNDARAVRRAGYYHGRSGVVLATVTERVAHAKAPLIEAGFKVVSEFVNPRTKRAVTVLIADVLRSQGVNHNKQFGPRRRWRW